MIAASRSAMSAIGIGSDAEGVDGPAVGLIRLCLATPRDTAECDARVGHAAIGEIQSDRSRGQREGVGLSMAYLLIRRGLPAGLSEREFASLAHCRQGRSPNAV